MIGLEFNYPINNIQVMPSRSVYLTTRFLERLSSYCGLLWTFFRQKETVKKKKKKKKKKILTTDLLELAEGRDGP